MRRFAVLAGLLAGSALAGCLPATPPPPWPEGTQAVLLVEDPGASPPRAIADAVGRPRATRKGRTLALGYPIPPESLGLPVGLLVESTPNGAPLPLPMAAFSLDEAGTWRKIDVASIDRARFLRPRPTYESCAATGGCYVPEDEGLCRIPCNPAHPEPPLRPTRPCPEGWSSTPVADGVYTCAPTWPARTPCEDNDWQAFEAAACAPVAECPAREWPEAPPGTGPLLHVRPGPAGGDGSAEAPFASVALALEVGGPGARILLGEGTFRAPLELRRAGITVRGLCPERTRIATSSVAALVDAPGCVIESLALETSSQYALRITERGDLVGVGLSVRAPAGTAVLAEGAVRLERARVDAATGLDVRGAAAQLHGVQVFAERGLVCASGADLTAVDGTIRGTENSTTDDALIELDGCDTVELRQLILQDTNGLGVRAEGYGTFVGEDLGLLDVRGYSAMLLTPDRSADDASTRTALARIFVSTANRGIRVAANHVQMDDVAVHAVVHQAVLVSNSLRPGPPTVLRGVWVTDTARAINATRNFEAVGWGDLDIEDLVVTQRSAPIEDSATVRIAESVALSMRRAWLASGGSTLVEVVCGGAITLRDITGSGFGPVGVFLESDRPALLERVSLEGAFLRGLHQIRSDSCGISDLDIVDLRLAGDRIGLGAVFDIGANASASRVDIARFDIGARVLSAGGLALSEASVRECRVGLEISEGEDLTQVLHGVALSENQRAVLRR